MKTDEAGYLVELAYWWNGLLVPTVLFYFMPVKKINLRSIKECWKVVVVFVFDVYKVHRKAQQVGWITGFLV